MSLNPKILFLITFGIAVMLIGAFYLFNSKKDNQSQNSPSPKNSSKSTSENLDYTASFAIYTNGTFRIFTAPMYHNLSADVFIKASNPNIVHVKKSNITWDDFFKTLPFELTKDCLTTGTKQTFCNNEQFTLQFYINGIRNQSVLDQTINSGDKFLVTYDRENATIIQKQIQSVPNFQ